MTSHQDAGSPLAVAGMRFVHHGAPGLIVPSQITRSWPGSRVVDAPVVVEHVLGDTDAADLRLIASGGLPTGDFYVDPGGELAVRVPGYPPGGLRPQLLRTLRRGSAYQIAYHQLDGPMRLPEAWHRTLTMVALPARRRGVLAHAAGFVLGGDIGVLCPGVSGTGKSTLARTMSQGVGDEIVGLSDDRVAVTRSTAGLQLWGTPWNSAAAVACASEAPLRAMVFVRRGGEARIAPMNASQALRILLRTVPMPVWDADATEFVLEVLDHMVANVPCFEFSYTPSATAARALAEQLQAAVLTGERS